MIGEFTAALLRALKTFFRGLPLYFRQDFISWLWPLPLVLAALVYAGSDANLFGWSDSDRAKDMMEILHPALLATGALLSLMFWKVTADYSLGLMAAICSSCLGRELGGQGTSSILIVGLFLCIWYTDSHREQMKSFLQSLWPRSLVALCFISYAGSQLLDRSVIKHSGRLLSGDDEWNLPYSSNMEESMESFGGFCLLLATLTLVVLIRRRHKMNTPR